MSNRKIESYVNHVYDMVHIKQNKGFAAKIKKGDNSATEYQSWEILARWTKLGDRQSTKSFALIGASIARSKRSANGNLGLGGAIRSTVDGKQEIEHSSGAVRLRRLLACQDQGELLRILRPTLRYLESKEIPVDYNRLLEDINWFNSDTSRERTRACWAEDFYRETE